MKLVSRNFYCKFEILVRFSCKLSTHMVKFLWQLPFDWKFFGLPVFRYQTTSFYKKPSKLNGKIKACLKSFTQFEKPSKISDWFQTLFSDKLNWAIKIESESKSTIRITFQTEKIPKENCQNTKRQHRRPFFRTKTIILFVQQQ